MTTGPDLRSSVHLDLVRGLAAMAVFAGHVRNLFLVDYGEVAGRGPGTAALYMATGLGHQAVLVFFVLSGYFITSSILRHAKTADWGGYATDRLVRLYVVLIPCLVLTLAWDSIGQTLAPDQAVYEGRHPGAMTVGRTSVTETTSLTVFASNLVFLQTIVAPPLGTNGPLWSLANEFWYYVAAPLLWVAGRGPGGPVARGLALTLATGVLWFVGRDIALLFPIWLFGGAVRLLPPVGRLRAPVALGGALAVAGAVVGAAVWYSRQASGLAGEYAVGLATAAGLYVLLHADAPARAGWYRRGATGLARVSFTLYACHLPVAAAGYAFAAGGGRWQPTPGNVGLYLGLLATGLGYACGLAWLTERHNERVRAWVGRHRVAR